MAKNKYIIKRGNIFYFLKEVPVAYRNIDKRRFVKISLKTDSETIAVVKAKKLNQDLMQYWAMLAGGYTKQASSHLESAIALAQSLGFAHINSSYLLIAKALYLPLKYL